MKRYIKIDSNNNIIAIFSWYQRWQFDGNEIYLDEGGFDITINNKNILNEYGFPIFIWNGSSAIEKLQSEIDNDYDFIIYYKILKKEQLFEYIKNNLYDINKILDQIRTQWTSFKQNASNWTTKQDIDNAYDQAIVWLHS